jgi:RimJ/RimL family protein N-acetyltransferase
MDKQRIHGKVCIETERLTLVALTSEHISELNTLDSDPAVMHFITDGMPRPPGHNEKAVPRLERYARENPGLGLWPVYLTSSGEFMGWYILKHLLDTGEVEIGFRIKKKFWNRGFSTEAGLALIQHGFETVGLKRIIAIVRPDNLASQSVIKKIGLTYEDKRVIHGIHCLYFSCLKVDRRDD